MNTLLAGARARVVERLPLLGSGKPDFAAAALFVQADGQPAETNKEDAHASAAA